MNKTVYTLPFLLAVAGGLLLYSCQAKTETADKANPKPLTAAEMNAEKKTWEASPDGVRYKNWEASPAGQKVLAGAARLRTPIRDSANMEAVVTSLSLPEGSRLGFGMMVRINEEEYILSFGSETADEFQQLRDLKVNDKILLKGRYVSYAPKYAYAIVAGNSVEHEGKILYKYIHPKGGC